MYSKQDAERLLRQLNEFKNGSTYGELENNINISFEEVTRLEKNLKGMIKNGRK